MKIEAAQLDNFTSKLVVWSPIVQIVVLTIGVVISFLVSYLKGDVSIYVPFISETGAIVPEIGIFSTTLIFGSLFGAIVVLYRYKVASSIIPEDCALAQKANVYGVLAGEVSMAGLAGVAAFPMSQVLIAHVITASIHFGLAVVYLFLQSYVSLKTVAPYYSRNISVFRGVLSVLLMIFLVLLMICLPIGYFTWLKVYPDRLNALKEPGDEVFELLLAAALFEWLFYLTFLTYMFTFTREFKKFAPCLSVQPDSDTSKLEKNDYVPRTTVD